MVKELGLYNNSSKNPYSKINNLLANDIINKDLKYTFGIGNIPTENLPLHNIY